MTTIVPMMQQEDPGHTTNTSSSDSVHVAQQQQQQQQQAFSTFKDYLDPHWPSFPTTPTMPADIGTGSVGTMPEGAWNIPTNPVAGGVGMTSVNYVNNTDNENPFCGATMTRNTTNVMSTQQQQQGSSSYYPIATLAEGEGMNGAHFSDPTTASTNLQQQQQYSSNSLLLPESAVGGWPTTAGAENPLFLPPAFPQQAYTSNSTATGMTVPYHLSAAPVPLRSNGDNTCNFMMMLDPSLMMKQWYDTYAAMNGGAFGIASAPAFSNLLLGGGGALGNATMMPLQLSTAVFTTTSNNNTSNSNSLAVALPGSSNTIEPFPEKLHRLLCEVEANGQSDVISWQENGMAFKIHQPDQFFEAIVPLYFKQSRLSSFKRQLNLYGFTLASLSSDKGGCYRHELFRKDKPEWTRKMRRVTSHSLSAATLSRHKNKNCDKEVAAAANISNSD